jgi:hypothetical protein
MHRKCNRLKLVGFEVLTAVAMKSTIFWDIMPGSLSQKMVLFRLKLGGGQAYDHSAD